MKKLCLIGVFMAGLMAVSAEARAQGEWIWDISATVVGDPINIGDPFHVRFSAVPTGNGQGTPSLRVAIVHPEGSTGNAFQTGYRSIGPLLVGAPPNPGDILLYNLVPQTAPIPMPLFEIDYIRTHSGVISGYLWPVNGAYFEGNCSGEFTGGNWSIPTPGTAVVFGYAAALLMRRRRPTIAN